MVLCKLREVNLKLNPKKCCFATKSITFLGHVVSEDGTRPNPGKDVDFLWDAGYQQAFQALRMALVEAPILIRPNFKRLFCLDVDWSPKGAGAILSEREGKLEKVVAYASKSPTEAQKKFHPMEGECYALIWGVMHFRQYLYKNHFVLRTDHKPLEWLATVSDAHGR